MVISDRPIKMMQRHPGIATEADVYAIEIAGDCLADRYYDGEYVFASPHKRVIAGDYVALQLQYEPGGPIEAHVKRFVSKDDNTLTVEQLNPHKALTHDMKHVVAYHRVFPPKELCA